MGQWIPERIRTALCRPIGEPGDPGEPEMPAQDPIERTEVMLALLKSPDPGPGIARLLDAIGKVIVEREVGPPDKRGPTRLVYGPDGFTLRPGRTCFPRWLELEADGQKIRKSLELPELNPFDTVHFQEGIAVELYLS